MAVIAIIGLVCGSFLLATGSFGAVKAKPKHHTAYLTIRVRKAPLSDSGGAVTVRAVTRGLHDCRWTAVPPIKGFNRSVKCEDTMSRVAHIGEATSARTYVLELHGLSGSRSVSGTEEVMQSGHIAVAVTASTPTASSSTTSPTNVTKSVTYSAKVDPSFTQNPANPLNVTYDYSADATQTVGTVQTDLAAIGQLPSGILNLYNNGLLVCSTAVGGSVTDALCGVNYAVPGQYTLVTTYQSGSTSATETDTENITINPITTTALTVDGILDQGSTQSILNAVFATAYGPLIGSTVAFNIGGAMFTPPAGNVSCTINWSGSVVTVPPWSSYVPGAGWVTYGQFGIHPAGAILDVTNNPFYYQLATSPNCNEVGDAKVPNMIAVNSSGSTVYSVVGSPNNALYQSSSDSLAA